LPYRDACAILRHNGVDVGKMDFLRPVDLGMVRRTKS
jgi:hypothetical protein